MSSPIHFQSFESRLFLSITALPVASPTLEALGDFNGDKKADEVVVTSSGPAVNPAADMTKVQIFIGHGNGSFGGAVNPDGIATIPDFVPQAVTTGDINGDGSLDVVILGTTRPIVTPLASTTLASLTTHEEVIVLFGNGTGRLLHTTATGPVAEQVISLPHLLTASSVAVGDFDGDGKADLAVLGTTVATAAGGSLAVIVRSAPAIDVFWDVYQPSTALNPVAKDTVIVPPKDPNVNELFAAGSGSGANDLIAAESQGVAIPIADIVAARPDLVTVSFPTDRTPDVTVGTNPLDPPSTLAAAASKTTSVIPIESVRTLGVADLTGNGDLDLLGMHGAGFVYSVFNPTVQTFGPVQNAASINAPVGIAIAPILIGDINGDGLSDLLADTVTGIYFGQNTPPTSAAGAVTFSWSKVALVPGGAA